VIEKLDLSNDNKKSYEAPQLRVYGDIRVLTHTNMMGGPVDGGGVKGAQKS